MTQEDKQLLLKDLCGRLPYGVKFIIDEMYLTEDMIKGGYDKPQELYGITCEGNVELLNMDYHMPIESIKPYLFPLSSMTEKQKEELLYNYIHNDIYFDDFNDYFLAGELWHDLCISMDILSESINWLNENHFDWRGLIPKGLANDATGLNIY